ncbi:MAG: ATP-binding protein, partial [Bryobacteraceae bacterium]
LCTWVISLRISASIIARRRKEEALQTAEAQRSAFIADVRGALTRGANVQAVTEAMVQHLDAALARVWTVGAEQDFLSLRASAGLSTQIDDVHAQIPFGHTNVGKVALNRVAVLTHDLAGESALGDRGWARRYGLLSFCGVPLLVDQRLVGVLAMFSRSEIEPAVLTMLGSVADAIAQAIQREHAESLLKMYAADLVDANARLEVQAAKLARTAEELALARDVALESAQLKSQFLANISHEIRTPMTGIIGMTELTLDTELSADQREYLTMIKSSSGALLQILNDTLDFSKIEAGKMQIERIPFNLQRTFDSSLKPLAQSAIEKKLRMNWRVAPEVPEILIGDPLRLHQILANLVGNAIKFTETGEIRIRAVVEHAEEQAVRVQFSVTDTGIGVPREKQNLIFLPFVQADGSTTRKYGGTGLGLAICRNLVRLMGGEIWVEGEVGVGSSFTFVLPFETEADAPRVAPPEPSLVPVPRRLRILMAEDNQVNQKLVARLLEKRGHAVVVANNGAEVLEAFARDRFDLILMDVQMPVMGGLEATAAIRRRERDAPFPSSPRVPIVAMTASAMQGDREQCLAAGMDGYVSKPIRYTLLFEAIDSALRN